MGELLPGPGMHLQLHRVPECFLYCHIVTWLASLGCGSAVTPYQFQVRITLIKSKFFSGVRSRNAGVINTVALFPCLSLVFHVWEEFQTWEFCGQTSEIFFFFFFFPDQDNTTNDKEQYQPAFHAPKGSGSKRDLHGDWRGSNSNYCLLLSSWTAGSTRPAFSWLLWHEAEQMCLLLMRWRMELFF